MKQKTKNKKPNEEKTKKQTELHFKFKLSLYRGCNRGCGGGWRGAEEPKINLLHLKGASPYNPPSHAMVNKLFIALYRNTKIA